MHKVILKGVVDKAFDAVGIAFDMVKWAYGALDRSGEHVLGEIDIAKEALRGAFHKAIDEL